MSVERFFSTSESQQRLRVRRQLLLPLDDSLFLPVPLVVDRESTTAIASDHGGTEGRPPPRVVSVMRPRVQ